MTFVLRDVGLDCFTLVLKDEDIGSVFSTDDGDPLPWVVTLSEQRFRTPSDRPLPFQANSHRFGTLGELLGWLGIPAAATGRAVEAAA